MNISVRHELKVPAMRTHHVPTGNLIINIDGHDILVKEDGRINEEDFLEIVLNFGTQSVTIKNNYLSIPSDELFRDKKHSSYYLVDVRNLYTEITPRMLLYLL